LARSEGLFAPFVQGDREALAAMESAG